MRIDLSCPIELIAYRPPAEGQPYCALGFFNLSEKKVISVQVTLTCFDAQGEQTLRRLTRVMDLSGEPKQDFEAAVPVDEDVVFTHIDLVIEKVWFDDNSVWRRTLASLHEYTPNELPPTRLREHLRFVAGQDAVGFPSEQGPVWVCVCGRPNAASEVFCRRCGRDKVEQFEQYNRTTVEKIIHQREQELEEKAIRARQEASEKEHQREQEIQKKMRKRRALVVSVTLLLVLLIGGALFVQFGLPALSYQQAEGLLTQGSPEAAKAAFLALGEYRDAPQRAKASEYQAALAEMQSNDEATYESGLARMLALGDFEDAPEQARQAQLDRAQMRIDEEDYLAAEPILTALGEDTEAVALLAQVNYEIGQQEMSEQAYEAAAERFTAAGGYQDAPERAQAAIYSAAGVYNGVGDFAKAATLYATIPDYEDAHELAFENVYENASQLLEGGQYEAAREQFLRLGAYKDAADQAMACVYLPAVAAVHAQNYDQAYTLFSSVPGYLDSDAQAQESLYLAAQADKLSGALDEAIEKFARIPEYKDTVELLNAAKYEKANQLEVAGAYEASLALFEELAGIEYDDAAARSQNVRYLFAQQLMQDAIYTEAKAQFAALGDYENAEQLALDCDYRMAGDLMANEKWQAAYEAFAALGAYEDSEELAEQSLYSEAAAKKAEGDFEIAASRFEALGDYEDAQAQAQDSLYQWAVQLEAEGEYGQAGALFTQVAGTDYADAEQRATQLYEGWLGGLRAQANEAIGAENYQEAILLLEDVPFAQAPAEYRDLATLYEESILNYARFLIESDNKLLARPYLEKVQNQPEAQRLLSDFIYGLVGQWTSPTGSVLDFREDGTCTVDGQEGYFNVEEYALMVGPTPYPTVRTHSIVALDDNGLSLRREGTEDIVKYTRVETEENTETDA